MENEKPMRKMETEEPGRWEENQESVVSEAKGRKFRREGAGMADAFEAGREVVVDNSSVQPRCGWWWRSGRR